jgi:Leucine Rich repeat
MYLVDKSLAFNYIETFNMYSSTTQTFIASTTAIAIQVSPATDPLLVIALEAVPADPLLVIALEAVPADPLLVIALEAVPAEDWCRTWPDERTIMLRMTSKRVSNAVDKMRPPAVVCLCRKYWYNFNARPEIVMRQLLSLVTNCRITTLKLERCNIDWEIQQLKEVLDQCPELTKLDLSCNNFNDGSFVDVLMQYSVSPQTAEFVSGLISLKLECCNIGHYAVARFANTLSELPALSCLNLKRNLIGDKGAKILAGVLRQCTALTSLKLGSNEISDGAISITRNLPQTLIELDLSHNYINCTIMREIATNLPKCDALANLDISSNLIRNIGAGRIARVLIQCTSLTSLNLNNNMMSVSIADLDLLRTFFDQKYKKYKKYKCLY